MKMYAKKDYILKRLRCILQKIILGKICVKLRNLKTLIDNKSIIEYE